MSKLFIIMTHPLPNYFLVKIIPVPRQ